MGGPGFGAEQILPNGSPVLRTFPLPTVVLPGWSFLGQSFMQKQFPRFKARQNGAPGTQGTLISPDNMVVDTGISCRARTSSGSRADGWHCLGTQIHVPPEEQFPCLGEHPVHTLCYEDSPVVGRASSGRFSPTGCSTWSSSMAVFYGIQDHPAYIPCAHGSA